MTNIPQDIVVIQRSKREHSIVFLFWRRMFLTFCIATLCVFLLGILMRVLVDLTFFCVAGFYSTIIPLIYSFVNKGSLADIVYVDFTKQEICVVHYTLGKRQLKTIIPFEGMTWDVYYGWGHYGKVRIFPKNGKRMVICEGTLGWTDGDSTLLESMLSRIVERKHGIFRR